VGDVAALTEQLGNAEGMGHIEAVAASASPHHIEPTLFGLQRFLDRYLQEQLTAHELPALRQAYFHAIRNQTRELIQLDKKIAATPTFQAFANASQRIGRMQLERLKPLRDCRLIQRYIGAMENGHARAWHTLVYAVLLATFSFPLRVGLVYYAEQTLSGFAQPFIRNELLSETQVNAILFPLFARIPGTVEQCLQLRPL
jgi:urease accessory protein UreF